jgi:hypothetical protein
VNPNLPLPSLTTSLLSPIDLQRHEKIHLNVPFMSMLCIYEMEVVTIPFNIYLKPLLKII